MFDFGLYMTIVNYVSALMNPRVLALSLAIYIFIKNIPVAV